MKRNLLALLCTLFFVFGMMGFATSVGAAEYTQPLYGSYSLVPTADTTDNVAQRDVIGNKTDAAAAGAVTETESIMAYIKQVVGAGVIDNALIDTILEGVASIDTTANGLTIYVDSANGDAGYDGLSWATAKATIAGGLALMIDDSTMFVGGSSYTEAVTTPGAGAPINRGKILSVCNGRQFPLWQSGATGSSHLTVIGADWEIAGFRFHSSANTAPYIALAKDVAQTEYVDGTIIRDCWFSGVTAKMAIQASGGVTACQIRNNRFSGFTTTGTYEGAICGTDYVQAAVFWEITDNFFANNTQSINLMMNACDVKRNSFTTATGYDAATLVIHTTGSYGTSGGGGNVVSDNYFSDVIADIDNTAGYYGSANDLWSNNHCTDADDWGVPAGT